ncbi:ArnT family glycosyltransferase [Crocosphaera sp. XPORK-15E]|uniref:ArnT family glycosyltransferase n=1 Tax=Crocosphaera sp. XPORK-15E TaxID=3110247 RepID=UPI002B21B7FC|nr:glycosyltransferase family 39 protein [Crocosphaera sp. XPORK-15E]MEA5536506.1 glycosyltransferase family 39 protein [Crocosphaera sp. XPORK-15E]
MNPLTFTWYPSKPLRHRRLSWGNILSWGGLFGAALILLVCNLDSTPLLPQELILAQVAQEMTQMPFWSGDWLFPTLQGQAYHQQPFLGLLFLAIATHWGGVDGWMIRLPGAMFAAVSVPLLYGLAREIFASWLGALFSALIYLTLFPVIYWGRLALFDGFILFWVILTVFCGLRSRRDFRWSLGLGLSLTGLLLTQGLIGLLLGVVLLIFLAWDTPRLLSCGYFVLGIILGVLPALTWYWMQWLVYGQPAIQALLWPETALDRGNVFPLLGFYPLVVLTSAWPWLIFAWTGGQWAWQSLTWGWAKLILVWGGGYLGMICLLPLAQMTYLLPFYPPLALAGGMVLREASQWPDDRPYPQWWSLILYSLSGGFSLLGLSIWLNFPLDFTLLPYGLSLLLTLGAIALTFWVTAFLINRRNPQFIAILLWGMYVSSLF